MKLIIRLMAAAALLAASVAQAAAPPPAAQPEAKPSWRDGAVKSAGEIATQPARDVGVARRDIPPPIEKAAEDPYSLAGLKTCRQLSVAIVELNAALGPDYKTGDAYHENRMAKLAQAGGRTVVNSIIPFRSLVREVTGAAPADRRLRSAMNAGFARRGFLRGVYASRSCKPKF